MHGEIRQSRYMKIVRIHAPQNNPGRVYDNDMFIRQQHPIVWSLKGGNKPQMQRSPVIKRYYVTDGFLTGWDLLFHLFCLFSALKKMAPLGRIELPTNGLGNRCSIP